MAKGKNPEPVVLVNRDFIPGDSKPTAAEAARGFSRDHLEVTPDFTGGAKAQPVGNAEAQQLEALKASKKRTQRPRPSIMDCVKKMDSLNVGDAISFLESLNDYERTRFLEAEYLSKQRKDVLRHFGR